LLRLRTLGGLSVERLDGSSPPVSVTSARRRLALLAVLAAAGPGGSPRDKLLALFWPESDIDRARHALDQTLYALKRSLDAETLVLGREELSLDPSAITSDVRELREALAKGDLEAAVELYAGPFLDGVFVTGAPEFERWLDGERDRLARDIEAALESLAATAASRRDHRAAATWWRRRLIADPTNARVVLALMSELAASGDPTAAFRQADLYRAVVAADPDHEPNPAVDALVEKLKRSAVVINPAARPTPKETRLDVPNEKPAAPRPTPPRLVRRYRALGTAAALVVVALSTAWMVAVRHADSDRGWVLPADFDNRTRDSIFDRALDAALSAGLEQSGYVNVFPRARVQQTLIRMGRSAAGVRLSEGLAREVAQREGIRTIVAGTIDGVDGNYVVTARLVDAASGDALWTEKSIARRRSDVIDAVDNLVRQLRRRIGESASSLAQRDLPLPQATTGSLEALRKYADAGAAARSGQRRIALELWEQAVAIDSDFALAHAELGAAYYFSNDRPRGDAHFARALALLDRLTNREQFLVRASAEAWRGNRERAIDLRRALLAQYPNDPSAWGQIGYDYMRLGRHADAVAAFRKQLARDSNDVAVLINLATTLRASPQNDEAIRIYRRAFVLQPSWLVVNNLNNEYGGALVYAGRLDDARAVFDTMRHGDADQRAQGERSTGLLSMMLGRYGDAIEHFDQAVLLSQMRGRELTEARNRLFLAAAEEERGWRDSSQVQLRAAHALFRKAYFEPRFLMYLGKALARGGQVGLASEVLDSLHTRAKPGNVNDAADLHVLTGEIALARGLADSAVRSFRLAVTVDSNPVVVESLARALVASGDLMHAARLYESLAEWPKHAFGAEGEASSLVAWRDAGGIYERLGDIGRARAAYERQLSQWTAVDSDLESVRDARVGLSRVTRGRLQPERR
jgi:DNA-binding SARP family transcriptional activator/tetratricopeptide (TPR) repeat protein